jgi:hypothetical protein
MTIKKIRADFNGLFGDILCLSHGDSCVAEDGAVVQLSTGMRMTAFDEDADENGQRDDLVASGTVDESPEWLQCNGSKWVLKIDGDGVRHESETNEAVEQSLATDSVERSASIKLR